MNYRIRKLSLVLIVFAVVRLLKECKKHWIASDCRDLNVWWSRNEANECT